MPDQSPRQSFVAAFLATVQGKFLTALAAVAILVGIAAEIISAVTGYYNMTKVRAEAEASTATYAGTHFYEDYLKDSQRRVQAFANAASPSIVNDSKQCTSFGEVRNSPMARACWRQYMNALERKQSSFQFDPSKVTASELK
jgi:hypothetical protein